jgi:hypothetical protein
MSANKFRQLLGQCAPSIVSLEVCGEIGAEMLTGGRRGLAAAAARVRCASARRAER